MKVYRISKTQYANDITGTGAKLYGGRWNHVNTPCIYTSESRALAILEYSVNINASLIPDFLSLCVFELNENKIHEIAKDVLPSDWKKIPSSNSTKTIGTDLLHNNKAIIRVPSITIPEEFNYIINPTQLGKDFELIETKKITYDLRIKQS